MDNLPSGTTENDINKAFGEVCEEHSFTIKLPRGLWRCDKCGEITEGVD